MCACRSRLGRDTLFTYLPTTDRNTAPSSAAVLAAEPELGVVEPEEWFPENDEEAFMYSGSQL